MRKFIALTLVILLISACTPKPPPTPTPTPVPSGPCTITPLGAVTAYKIPSAAGEVFGTLNYAVEATSKTADGFYGFDPGVAQAGNSGIYRLRWALKTVDLQTSPGCANIPTVVGPIAGLCYAMLMTDTPVYASADTGSSILVTLHNGDFVMVTAHDSGWLTTDLNVGSANVDNIGYIEDSLIGGLKGTCEGF